MPTIIDVAKRANVSKSTVSRVLAGEGNVSKESRDAVMKAVEELNFVKNSVASSMRTRKSKTVLLIIPDITNNFWSEVSRGAQIVLDKKGYSLMVANSDWQKDREERYLQLAMEHKVDAVMINAPDMDMEKVSKMVDTPIVVLGERSQKLPFPIVGTDSYKAIRKALDYVWSKGHKRIGIVLSASFDSEGTKNSTKYRAYCDWMKEKNIDINEKWVINIPLSIEGGKKLFSIWRDMDEKPSVILTGNDLVAVGFTKSARDDDVVVPDDVSLVGFDDIPLVGLMSPGITTLQKPKSEIGAIAAERILEMLDGKTVPERTLLDSLLIERESVKGEKL